MTRFSVIFYVRFHRRLLEGDVSLQVLQRCESFIFREQQENENLATVFPCAKMIFIQMIPSICFEGKRIENAL